MRGDSREIAKLNRIRLNAFFKKKKKNATSSEVPSLISPHLAYGFPPSLALRLRQKNSNLWGSRTRVLYVFLPFKCPAFSCY